MARQWQETMPGKYDHNWIAGLFAEVCKSGKYLIFQTTPHGYRNLWCKVVSATEFINYSL